MIARTSGAGELLGPEGPLAHGAGALGILANLSLLVVLAFVLVGTFTWMASSARVATWRETAAVLLYRENFELIDSQLGYDAAGVQTSPLQHFWSLSVQGQVFLVWPLLLAGAAAGSTQLQLEKAAQTAARQLARGETAAVAASAVRRIAGSGATLASGNAGGWITVSQESMQQLLQTLKR